MKALTLKQPWAWAVIEAGKWIENRSWEPPEALLGETFAIHAGLKKPTKEVIEAAVECATEAGRRIRPPTEFPLGYIVGVARLDGYVSVRDDGEWADCELASGERRASIVAAKKAFGSPWFFGPVGFLLKDVRSLREPIPCKGALGFWNLQGDLERAVRRQLGRARARARSLKGAAAR